MTSAGANTTPEELWAHERISMQEWEFLNEVEREQIVKRIRQGLTWSLAQELLKRNYIEVFDSKKQFNYGEDFVQLTARIRVGYKQRTVYAEMPTRMMLNILWLRLWRRAL